MGNGLLCGFAIGSSSSGWNFLYKNEEKKIREKKTTTENKKLIFGTEFVKL